VTGATNVSSATSSRAGDGQVTVTFDPATDTCPAAPTAVVVTPRFTG
jgi:hypothetical protein